MDHFSSSSDLLCPVPQMGHEGVGKLQKCNSEAERFWSAGMACPWLSREVSSSSAAPTQITARNWESVLEGSLWTCCCLVFFSSGKRCCRGNRKDSGLTRSGCVIFAPWSLLEHAGELACVYEALGTSNKTTFYCVFFLSSAEKNSCGTLQGFD